MIDDIGEMYDKARKAFETVEMVGWVLNPPFCSLVVNINSIDSPYGG